MRTLSLLVCLFIGPATGHPFCYVGDRPTDPTQVLEFCPEAGQGACCTDLEEAEVEAIFNEAEDLTGDCAEFYKKVVCGRCHSFSAHLYERLGAELGTIDGMTMKSEFCESLVEACTGQITFPVYDDGDDYCTKHTGGGNDQFWSYPYEEPEIFEPGINQAFPDLDNKSDFPEATISVHQSPEGDMYWLMGKNGEIKKVDSDDLTTTSTVVDISGGELYVAHEEGLLDFAFDPIFGAGNNFFYLSYTCQLNGEENGRNRLSKFEYFSGDPASTLASEEVLLTTIQKASSIHSAGWVGFKPSDSGNNADYHDIYWTTGDGGPQTDPLNTGQDTTHLLGSVMRISMPSAPGSTGYKIPSGNMKDSDPDALPEICASGLRNPWRCSFDRETDKLYCGDVGHTRMEEIDIIECGNNYGWSRFEGSRCQEDVEDRDGPCLDADRAGFTFPWFEYCHPDYSSTTDGEDAFTGGVDICGDRSLTGHAVIGGYIYRGMLFADLLYGAYIFGDVNNRNIYFVKNIEGEWAAGSIVSDGSVAIIAFAENADGELMLITSDYNIYNMPCGDLCSFICLEQAEELPSYESLGCFADFSSSRALTLSTAPKCDSGEEAINPEICISYCATVEGATYAGVEFSSECFCGGADSDYDKNGSLDPESCQQLCTAYPDQFCGGLNAIEVFQMGEVPSPTPSRTPSPTPSSPSATAPVLPTPVPSDSSPSDTSSYLGCYADKKNPGRIMERMASSDNMSSEVCKVLCAGSVYYGTQYSEECWCGDENTNYKEHGEGVCDMPCTGRSSETCGGYISLSVYQM